MIGRVALYNKRDFKLFFFVFASILLYSLLISYNNYKSFTRFDSQLIDATVIKQYEKDTKHILKLRSDDGLIFYTSAKISLPYSVEKKLNLEVWAGKISFYEYLTSFYAYSKIKNIYDERSLKYRFNSYISSQHKDKQSSDIYKALFSATPLDNSMQKSFSTLGVSHLFAISGFHLGVLSTILFFILRPVYTFFQDKHFPYRNSKRDIFTLVVISLFIYMTFLDTPPSLLRAFTMLLIGFVLYDRGIEIISMQTLFITVLTLLVMFPKLFFSLGFFLSVLGVYYIFLFLKYYKHLSVIRQFILIPFWIYILMLPFSLNIFENFSIYHPLSILWTTLFSIFYPLSIILHIFNMGDIFDSYLLSLMEIGKDSKTVIFDFKFLAVHIFLSFLSLYDKRFIYPLLFFSLSVFIYSIYHVT